MREAVDKAIERDVVNTQYGVCTFDIGLMHESCLHGKIISKIRGGMQKA